MKTSNQLSKSVIVNKWHVGGILLTLGILGLAFCWSFWFFNTFPHFVKYEKVPSGSYSTIVWDTSKTPWKSMPNCVMVDDSWQSKGYTWCDNFSSDTEVHLQLISDYLKN